jgi:transcription elongation factor GreA
MRQPITKKGFEMLQKELDDLKSVKRPQLSQAIADARAHGDLKENAEYHAAREQQGLMEARIRDLESKLSNAHVIDVTIIPHSGKVIFGTTLVLLNVNTDAEVRYQIVCEDEADFKIGKISVSSPIARALIGKEEGQVVSIQTPGGLQEYEILEVLHI